MENLKTLMGDSYKDELTIEDINAFLEGKKLVDLNGGEYVARDKYEKVVNKSKEDAEKAKLLEELQPKYEEYVQKERQDALIAKAKNSGIKEEFIEFAISKVGKDVEDIEAALKEFAQSNPQFTTKADEEEPQRVVVDSNPPLSKGESEVHAHDLINDSIRRSAGFIQ